MRKQSRQNAVFFRGGYRPYESCDFTRSNCLIYI